MDAVSIKRHKEILQTISAINNFSINEKRIDIMAEKFAYMKEQHGAMYCPCQISMTVANICPCHYMLNHKACRCGLFTQNERKVNAD